MRPAWRLGFGVTETLGVSKISDTLTAPFPLPCAPGATVGTGVVGVPQTGFPAGVNVRTSAFAHFSLLSCSLGTSGRVALLVVASDIWGVV